MRVLEPPGLTEPPGRVARGVELLPGQRIVHVTGPSDDVTGPQDVQAQAHAQFVTAVVVLAEAGMGLGDVFHVSAFVTSRADLASYLEARDQVFARQAVPPTSSVVIVAGLEDPDARVAISLWAAAV